MTFELSSNPADIKKKNMGINNPQTKLVTQGYYKFNEIYSEYALVEFKPEINSTSEMQLVDLASFIHPASHGTADDIESYELLWNTINVYATTEDSYFNKPYNEADPANFLVAHWVFVSEREQLEFNKPIVHVEHLKPQALIIEELNKRGLALLDKIKADPRNELPTGEEAYLEENHDYDTDFEE